MKSCLVHETDFKSLGASTVFVSILIYPLSLNLRPRESCCVEWCALPPCVGSLIFQREFPLEPQVQGS